MTRTHHKTMERFQLKNRQHTTCIENLSIEPISRKK